MFDLCVSASNAGIPIIIHLTVIKSKITAFVSLGLISTQPIHFTDRWFFTAAHEKREEKEKSQQYFFSDFQFFSPSHLHSPTHAESCQWFGGRMVLLLSFFLLLSKEFDPLFHTTFPLNQHACKANATMCSFFVAERWK